MAERNSTSDDRAPGEPGFFSRRRLLRLAAGGLTLATLTTGAVGCDDGGAVETEDPGSAGAGRPKGEDEKPADGATGGDGKAPKPLWTKTTSAETYGDNDELVVAAGVVLASGSPLVALDTATGKRKWSLPGGAVPGAPLLLGKDTLYLASSRYDGTVTGYDPASGKETWRSRLGAGYRQPRPVAVDDTQVYVIVEILEDDGSSKTNVIAALPLQGTGRAGGRAVHRRQRTESAGRRPPRTGKVLWQSTSLADAGLQVPRQYVKVGESLFGATDLDAKGGIIAMDARTGDVRWTFNDGSGDHHAWLAATDGERLFALHGTALHALPV